jgi:hypothetical protein
MTIVAIFTVGSRRYRSYWTYKLVARERQAFATPLAAPGEAERSTFESRGNGSQRFCSRLSGCLSRVSAKVDRNQAS